MGLGRVQPEARDLALTVGQVLDRVGAAQVSNVVVTGGEPLLQQQSIAQLAVALKVRGHRIEVETNGTRTPTAELAQQWTSGTCLRS